MEQQKGNRMKRLRMWLMVIVLGIVGVLCYKFVFMPLSINGFGFADTRPVPGDPANFDPVAALPGVREYAGERAQLTSIDAEFVRSDGTLDLTATYKPAPTVEYEFVREVPPPADAPPPGAGGANTGAWYEPVNIKAYEPGHWWYVSGTNSYSYMNQGMERDTSSPHNGLYDKIVPDPACSFADLWQIAMTKDAPKDAVATIEYDEYGYDFSITGLSVDLRFDIDCKLRE